MKVLINQEKNVNDSLWNSDEIYELLMSVKTFQTIKIRSFVSQQLQDMGEFEKVSWSVI